MRSAARSNRSTAALASMPWHCRCRNSSASRCRLVGKTILVTSQSGESAEILRWFAETGVRARYLRPDARRRVHPCPHRAFTGRCRRNRKCLCGDAQPDCQFCPASRYAQCARRGSGRRRSLSCNSRQQAECRCCSRRIVGRIGCRNLRSPHAGCRGSDRARPHRTSRIPCFSLEGGQLRHGPMEMLGPKVGVVLFRAKDATSELVAPMAVSRSNGSGIAGCGVRCIRGSAARRHATIDVRCGARA